MSIKNQFEPVNNLPNTPERRQAEKNSFNIIGAGRLGLSIAFTLIHQARFHIQSIYNQTLASAQKTAERLEHGKAVAQIEELNAAEIVWITVPDDQIEPIIHELAQKQIIPPGTMVVHCSGVLSSDILSPLAAQGCLTASLHPLKAFSGQSCDPLVFQDCYCALEGMPAAVKRLSELFAPLGAKLIPINPQQKARYHAAACMTSNYLITLAATGIHLFEEAGIAPSDAKNMTEQLMQSSLKNLQNSQSADEALTGPLMRGDLNTIKMHLNSMEKCDEVDLKNLYSAAGLATIPLTKLTPSQQEAIKVACSLDATIP